MSNISEFIKNVNEDIKITKNKFLYYCDKTGKISKILNRYVEDENFSVLEVDESLVSDIFNGTKQMSQFRVEYDLTSKCKSLVELNQNSGIVTLTHSFYQIPKNIETECDLTIIQNVKTKKWLFKVDESLLNMLDIDIFANKKLMFSIADTNDPNIFYKSIVIDLQDLLKNQDIGFNVSEISGNDLDVSIYTSKYFNTYKHEVIDE